MCYIKRFFTLLISLAPFVLSAQAYIPVKTNWQDAGYRGTRPVFTRSINIIDYGADNTGTAPCGTALTDAIAALNGASGTIYFPAGSYYFNTPVTINEDSIILRGAGYDSTVLSFNLSGQLSNLISINGTSTTDTSSITASAFRGLYVATVNNAAAFHIGDWACLSMNDQSYMTSSWAYGSLSQLMQVQGISGNILTFFSPFRFNYTIGNKPFIRRIIPKNNIGIECLKVLRTDATAGQSSNIAFDAAVNCWVSGIESDSANFAHIEINHSSNIEVTNSYFHHAFAYGGNGQAYGVLLQFGSNECKLEANYFHHLRHSMVLQAGANGNVLAYNYSTAPFWTEPNLPDSSAGEIVLHGNYPFMNLAEGNFVNNIVIDDSHGKNGPLNTFFRNRAEGYGIFMNFNPATDSVQFIGNEITNNQIGLNFLQGHGHLVYDNNYRGTITSGVAGVAERSLYLSDDQRPPCTSVYDSWPVVGRLEGYNTGTIYAKARVLLGKPASCNCVDIPVATAVSPVSGSCNWDIVPNPASDLFEIKGCAGVVISVEIYDLRGVLVQSQKAPVSNIVTVSHLIPGLYSVRIASNKQVIVRKLIKN